MPTAVFWSLAFAFSTLFDYKNQVLKKVFHTVATKQAAVLSTNGIFEETQMCDTNNKRSVGLSENKKARCLKFSKFAYTVWSFISI